MHDAKCALVRLGVEGSKIREKKIGPLFELNHHPQ